MEVKRDANKIYKAVFFDRDHTLLHGDPAAKQARTEMIERWSDKPLVQPPGLFDRLYGDRQLMTVENEIALWRTYFAELLRTQGITEQISARCSWTCRSACWR